MPVPHSASLLFSSRVLQDPTEKNKNSRDLRPRRCCPSWRRVKLLGSPKIPPNWGKFQDFLINRSFKVFAAIPPRTTGGGGGELPIVGLVSAGWPEKRVFFNLAVY